MGVVIFSVGWRAWESGSHTDDYFNTNADANTNTNADSDTNSYSNTDANTDADTNAGSESCCESELRQVRHDDQG